MLHTIFSKLHLSSHRQVSENLGSMQRSDLMVESGSGGASSDGGGDIGAGGGDGGVGSGGKY